MRSLRLGAALMILAIAAAACSASGATSLPAATGAPAATPAVAGPAVTASVAAASAAASGAGYYSGRNGGGDQATGSSGGSRSPAPTAGGPSAKIVDFGFQPASLTVKIGATVTWTNTGAAPHTVTADAGSFDSGTIPPGGTFSQEFTAAGTFAYHCNIHRSMTATVTVTP